MALKMADHLKKEALKLSLRFHIPEEGIEKIYGAFGIVTTPIFGYVAYHSAMQGLEGAPILGIIAILDGVATPSFFGAYDRSTSSDNILDGVDYSNFLLDKDFSLTEYKDPWTLWKNEDYKICTEKSHFPKLIRKDGSLGQSFHEIKFKDGYLIGISGSGGHVIGPEGESIPSTNFTTKGKYGKDYDAYPANRLGFMYAESSYYGPDYSRPPLFKILAKTPNLMMAEYL